MGAVFLAYDTTLHRPVALKVVDQAAADSETSRSRLLREARSAAALNHPNICTIHEVGHESGTAFIAMEYVEGRSLRELLDEGGALPFADALRYAIQTADALAYAHEHGVVHRDLKAANIMISTDARLKVVDFGLARREDALVDRRDDPRVGGAGRCAGGNPVCNGARTGARRRRRRAHRRLGTGSVALRTGDGDEAVCGCHRSRAVFSDPQRAAAAVAEWGGDGAPAGDRALPRKRSGAALSGCARGAPRARDDSVRIGAGVVDVALSSDASGSGWRQRPWSRLRRVSLFMNVGGLRDRIAGRPSRPRRSSWRSCRLKT